METIYKKEKLFYFRTTLIRHGKPRHLPLKGEGWQKSPFFRLIKTLQKPWIYKK